MEIRPIDPLDRVSMLEQWESNDKRNQRRAMWSAWASVFAALVVLAALIYFGYKQLNAVRSQVNTLNMQIKDKQAQLDYLDQEIGKALEQSHALNTILANVDTKQAKAAVDQTLNQNPQVAKFLPRVYLQIVDQNDRDYANYMGQKLRQAGFIVLGVEYRADAYRPDAKGLKATDVRYYKKADEAGAQKVLDALKQAGENPIKLIYLGLEDNTQVKANHFEVWFAANSGAKLKDLTAAASH